MVWKMFSQWLGRVTYQNYLCYYVCNVGTTLSTGADTYSTVPNARLSFKDLYLKVKYIKSIQSYFLNGVIHLLLYLYTCYSIILIVLIFIDTDSFKI